MWGRLGYPRRALRLHAAATAIVERHDGEVPASYDDLLALPGIGDYTAAAIASFAFGRRHVVLDTNVRRVLARAVSGRRVPRRRRSPGPSATWPTDAAARRRPPRPPRGRCAVMELGALVCTARQPACDGLPDRGRTAPGAAAGYPAYDGPPRRGQAWAGTDRQCRGRLLARAPRGRGPGARAARLEAAWTGGRAARAVPGRRWSPTGSLTQITAGRAGRSRGDLSDASAAVRPLGLRHVGRDRRCRPDRRPGVAARRRRRPSRTAAGRAARRSSGPRR